MARKILLADDSVTAQNMGRKILADAGYEVITVNNGSAALKKIAELKPEIIILDVYMPGYSGLEVCQRLKEAQETSRIPVLLTVGKLEPFKPEEAKRVRAEGYIVKPFEASELLSALSKLEDKIVPRAEPSKPGRFARANAALDEGKYEGRYDKTVAVEEDSGWKNRIGFPSKNKKVAQEDGDDSSIYNAVNKDLRTVVDRKPAHEPQEAKAEESRFDLGALAPEGLPKDVTPEEIAALAAAAAQVKGKLAEPGLTENLPELPATVLEAAKAAEVHAAEVKHEEKQEVKAEAKPEAKAKSQPAAELPTESEVPAATLAAQKAEESVEASSGKLADAVKDSVADARSAAEMMAAIAGLVPESGKSMDSSSGNGFGSHGVQEHSSPEHHASADHPVTMAAAAGAGFSSVASRWTAVAVALAPEEAAISLEHEMQKAYAAFAAAEFSHAGSVASVPEIQPAAAAPPAAQTSSPVELSPVEAVAAEVAPSPSVPVQEVAHTDLAQAPQSASPVASAATEALTNAVKEFERVASHVEPQPPVELQAPEAPEAPPVQATEPVAQSAYEAPQVVEAKSETKIEDSPVAEAPAWQPEEAQPEIAERVPEPLPAEQKHEEQKHQVTSRPESFQSEPRHEEPRHGEAVPVAAAVEEKSEVGAETADTAVPAVVSEAHAGGSCAHESVAHHASADQGSAKQASGYRSFANEAAADQVPASPVSSETAPPTAPAQPGVEGTKEVVKKESEIAETTAAAWASWRRIRESGDLKAVPSQPAKPKAEAPAESVPVQPNADAAAMAVAAGAEKSPEEVPAAPEDSGEIASIVDSMLADMRPRIVEEVSRKLGKKK